MFLTSGSKPKQTGNLNSIETKKAPSLCRPRSLLLCLTTEQDLIAEKQIRLAQDHFFYYKRHLVKSSLMDHQSWVEPKALSFNLDNFLHI